MLKSGETTIGFDTTIIHYTDGLTDLYNNNHINYAIDDLINFVNANSDKDMKRFNEKLISALYEFKGNQPFEDDVTILSVRIF